MGYAPPSAAGPHWNVPTATAGIAVTPNAMPMPLPSPPAIWRIWSPDEATSDAVANVVWWSTPSSFQDMVPLLPPPPLLPPGPPVDLPEPQPAAPPDSTAASARHAAPAAIAFELLFTRPRMPERARTREPDRYRTGELTTRRRTRCSG